MSIVGRLIARRYLSRANKKHLEEFPQVACFSFDLITAHIHLDGQYERDQLEFLSKKVFPFLPRSGACLDVGANIGNHALQFAQSFEQVIAFEPHPRTFKLLSFNADLVPNVTALNLGASFQNTDVLVAENSINMGATGIDRDGTGSKVPFRLVRIDDTNEVQALTLITFMKFDIEGHEYFAIDGARETIMRHKPVIALEILSDEISNGGSAATELLRSLGYAHFYEAVEDGVVGKLPFALHKIARTFKTIFSGRRSSKASRLKKVGRLQERDYPMLLCTTTPLADQREV